MLKECDRCCTNGSTGTESQFASVLPQFIRAEGGVRRVELQQAQCSGDFGGFETGSFVITRHHITIDGCYQRRRSPQDGVGT